jgi:hypothetical protein
VTAQFFVRAIIWPLSIYSAFRNYNLVQSTIGDTTLGYIAGMFALFALDAGALIWTEIAFRIDSDTQDKISKSMVMFDLIGAMVGVVADTMLITSPDAYQSTISIVAVFAIPLVITLNAIAGFAYLLSDPMRQIKSEQRSIERESEMRKKRAELDRQGAIDDAEAARLRLEATDIRNATTRRLLHIEEIDQSQNGRKPSATMAADGAPAPKAGRKTKA